MNFKYTISFIILFGIQSSYQFLPLVITTWNFTNATIRGWEALNSGMRPIDALVEGCSVCERERCDRTVGYGGSPDENGETTLDAMVMDGNTMDIGAVAGLRNIKDVIAVARHVLENTEHTLLVGNQATAFATQMGFKTENLSTEESRIMHANWLANNCQPNFWKNVVPSPSMSCGPYEPISANTVSDVCSKSDHNFGSKNHDTIGMIIIDNERNVVAGTSTNGARNKIPGRVGDSPIPGAGAYADSTVGAAVATGDGDVMMRFLPSFLAVEQLRSGATPTDAGEYAIRRITKHYTNFVGAVIVASSDGNFGAACHGMTTFPYSIHDNTLNSVEVHSIPCFS